MMLNKFLDKTFKAAKQSAQQIYGDDFSEIKEIIPKEKEDGGQKNGSGKRNKQQSTSADKKGKADPNSGVVFERSTQPKPDEKDSSDKALSTRLQSIRKYAAQQSNEDDNTSFNQTDSSADANPTPSDTKNKTKSISRPSATSNVYSRKDIRKQTADTKKKGSANESPKQEFDTVTLNNMQPSSANGQEPLYDKHIEGQPKGVSPTADTPEKQKENNTGDIHKRLDRLESLMHLALSTPDATYSEHPTFHKLLHKGVSQKLIRGWFENIVAQGIEPAQQPELFHSKLLQHIDELLQQSTAAMPEKGMLFAGRSGAGKTHLIMRLASLPNFWADKETAIVSFTPVDGSPKNQYSILEPFCDDHKIDFYQIQNAEQAKAYIPTWKNYDHVLVDTPALEIGGQSLIEGITTLRKELQKQIKTETHYLVNTAVNGTAFNDPLAQDIEADHIALTHIDQALKWGKTVQLLANTNYKLRYISSGPSITGNLLSFDPDKFARKLLRA